MCPCNPETGYVCAWCKSRAIDAAAQEAYARVLKRLAEDASDEESAREVVS